MKWYTPILWVDGRVQQLVDAIAFVFMRRGISKTMLFYTVLTVFFITLVADVFADHLYEDGSLFEAVGITLLAIVGIILVQPTLRMQLAADERGLAGPWDHAVFGPFKLVGIVGGVAEVLDGGILLVNIFGCTHGVAFTLLVYLRDTPRTPPPSEQVDLQLAPSRI